MVRVLSSRAPLVLSLCGLLAVSACDEGDGGGRLGAGPADGGAGGKADDNDEDSDDDADEDDESLLDLIKNWKSAWDDTKELFHECVEAFNEGTSMDHFIEKGACSLPPEEHFARFSHFVDNTWFEEDAEGNRIGKFTSVQDFYIERPDLEPEEVLDLFKADWDVWWDSLGTDPDTAGFAVDWEDAEDGHEACANDPMPDDCLWHQEIAPIKIPAVNIFMSVDDGPLVVPGDVTRGVRHPELDNPTRDPAIFRDEDGSLVRGHERHWDAGLLIKMEDRDFGGAFRGIMVVLATKNEAENRIDVREIWYRTAAVSPLVMRVVPFFIDLTDEQLLSIPPLLHLLATQGCVPGLAPNSGYPGLFQKLESGELLPPTDPPAQD